MQWFPTFIAATITTSEDAKANGMKEVGEGLLLLEDVKARERLKGEKLLDASKTPSLHKWADEFLSDDTVKNVVPGIDKVAKLIGDVEAKTQSAASTS
ncbi:unnamed protein product [Microthlaspi erraticum]|uniref:Uncharacterized protein n=1 Tax=Microthlaspi erraticum TaxID=1685480 RepID=A0A6D2KGZ3_9BRAS|nr:unnamed protein product [Microthlaspi erraticum]